MDCLNPLAPDDEELLRFALDGEAVSEEMSRHLEQCTTCQQRLARYEKAHSFLVSHLYRSQCPSGTELSLYCAGFLPEDQRISIANHILDCPLCAAEAKDTRQFLAETSDLLPSHPLPLYALNGSVRRIFATLVRQQAQLVVRGDTDPAAWPRQYRADSTDLSLHLSRASSGAFMLLGILTDPRESIEAFEGTLAELYPAAGGKNASRAEKPLLSEQVDDLGNIVFNAVPVGEYVMIVHLPGREMIVEGLTIESG
jgi:hypothetical protein